MLTKTLLKILLVIVALEQQTLAKPATTTTTTTNHEASSAIETTANMDLCHYNSKYKSIQYSENDKALSASVQLLKLLLSALMNISMAYADKAKIIADEILKDNELLNHADNDEVKTFKQQLETFENAYKDCNSSKQLFKMVELFSSTSLNFYEQEQKQTLSPQGKIILKLLKQHKVEKLDQEFDEDIKKFVTKFEAKHKEVEEDLRKEALNGKGEKVLQWQQQFSNPKTNDEKLEAFHQLYYII